MNVQDSFGKSLLMHACYKGNFLIVSLLLDFEEIDVNQTDNLGWTALTYACSKRDDAIVSLLLSHPDINPNIQNEYQSTPLIKACNNGDVAIIRLLLQHRQIDPNIQDDMGMTALMWASYRGNAFIVQMFLHHYRTDSNIISNNGKKAIDYSCNAHIKDLLRPFFVDEKNTSRFLPLAAFSKNTPHHYSSSFVFLMDFSKNVHKKTIQKIKTKLSLIYSFLKQKKETILADGKFF